MKTQNRYRFYLCWMFAITSLCGYSQTDTIKYRTFHTSFVPPLSTNGVESPNYVNSYSFNLLVGHTGGTNGIEIGGAYNIGTNDVKGVQIAGVGNSIGGQLNGSQIGGLINTTHGSMSGIQLSGITNISLDSAAGAQIAGLLNLSKGMSGIQVSGGANYSEAVAGAQVSGAVNRAEEMKGVQLAGINIARKLKGVQFGVINISDSVVSGMPVGVINVVKKNGFISPGLEYDDVVPYRIGFRSGINGFYTVMTVGARVDEYWTYGAGLGSRIFLTKGKGVFINPEARWENINKGKAFNDGNNHLIRLNVNFGLQILKHFYLTGGPSINFYFTNGLDEAEIPEIDLGDNFYVNQVSGDYLYRVWMGYSLGIGF